MKIGEEYFGKYQRHWGVMIYCSDLTCLLSIRDILGRERPNTGEILKNYADEGRTIEIEECITPYMMRGKTCLGLLFHIWPMASDLYRKLASCRLRKANSTACYLHDPPFRCTAVSPRSVHNHYENVQLQHLVVCSSRCFSKPSRFNIPCHTRLAAASTRSS